MHRTLALFASLLLACGASSDPAPAPHPSTASGTVGFGTAPVSGGTALVIDNGGGTAIRVRREIEVERQNGAAWEHVDASWLLVRATCDENDPPACVEIASGATLRTAPWTHMFGDAQCACEECGPAGPGTYRFAVTPCDGSPRVETAPFTVE